MTRRVHRHFEALNCKRKKQISKALPSPYGSGRALLLFCRVFHGEVKSGGKPGRGKRRLYPGTPGMAALVGLQNRIGTETNGEKFEVARLIVAGLLRFFAVVLSGRV